MYPFTISMYAPSGDTYTIRCVPGILHVIRVLRSILQSGRAVYTTCAPFRCNASRVNVYATKYKTPYRMTWCRMSTGTPAWLYTYTAVNAKCAVYRIPTRHVRFMISRVSVVQIFPVKTVLQKHTG